MSDSRSRMLPINSMACQDATELSGTYDFAITYAGSSAMLGRGGPPAAAGNIPLGNSADSDFGVPLFGAIQSQLGLKLESKKGLVEMIVVDRAEKTPTEN
jgi:uncharacterized protein (TIGR03435 family)